MKNQIVLLAVKTNQGTIVSTLITGWTLCYRIKEATKAGRPFSAKINWSKQKNWAVVIITNMRQTRFLITGRYCSNPKVKNQERVSHTHISTRPTRHVRKYFPSTHFSLPEPNWWLWMPTPLPADRRHVRQKALKIQKST